MPRRSPPRPASPVKKAPWRAHHPRSAAPSPAPHLTEAAEWPGGSGRPAHLLILRVQVLAAGPRPCGHLAASSGTSRGRGAAVRGCSGVWLSRCSSDSAGDFTTGRSPGPGAASEHQSRELRGCARVLARVRAATGHRRPAAPPGARHPGLSTALPAAPPRAPPPNTTGTRSHRSRGAVPLRLVSVQSRTWGASLPTLCPQPPGGSHGSCPRLLQPPVCACACGGQVVLGLSTGGPDSQGTGAPPPREPFQGHGRPGLQVPAPQGSPRAPTAPLQLPSCAFRVLSRT